MLCFMQTICTRRAPIGMKPSRVGFWQFRRIHDRTASVEPILLIAPNVASQSQLLLTASSLDEKGLKLAGKVEKAASGVIAPQGKVEKVKKGISNLLSDFPDDDTDDVFWASEIGYGSDDELYN